MVQGKRRLFHVFFNDIRVIFIDAIMELLVV